MLEKNFGTYGYSSKEEVMLYYLYMMADGDVPNNEKKIFNTICKDLKIDNDTKKSLIKKCRGLVDGADDILNIIIREKLDEEVGQVGVMFFHFRGVSSSARIIWNLLNLGYADSVFSDEEKKIVNYLIDKWSVNPEVYQEFVDTFDTILALEKQKEWIASTFPESSARNKRKRNIDTIIKQLHDDVKLTIDELAM